MIISKGSYGQIVIAEVINGVLVHKQYYGYTKKEALRLFKERERCK